MDGSLQELVGRSFGEYHLDSVLWDNINTTIFQASRKGRKVVIKIVKRGDHLKEKDNLEEIAGISYALPILECIPIKISNTCQYWGLVLGFCNGGDAHRLASKAYNNNWNSAKKERCFKSIMWRVVTSLRDIHSMSNVHCDVKPENIFLEENGEDKYIAYLGDYGSMDAIGTERPAVTWRYVPPEYISDPIADPKLDIWAVGASLLFMMGSRDFPVKYDKNEREFIRALMNITDEDIREVVESLRITDPMMDFICACMRIDPEARPTADDLLRHPWFEGMNVQNMKKEIIMSVADIADGDADEYDFATGMQ